MSSAIKRLILFVTIASFVVILETPAHAQLPAQQGQGRWTKAATFPEPEEELYGVAANGKMYVLGGFGDGGKPVGMNWEYDPATDKWTKKKDIPLPVHHSALASYNGKVYMFGGYKLFPVPQGFGGWEPVDNVWVFDPVADSW